MDCIQGRNGAYNAVRSDLGTKEGRVLCWAHFYFFLNLIIITEIAGFQRVLITSISLLFYEAILKNRPQSLTEIYYYAYYYKC